MLGRVGFKLARVSFGVSICFSSAVPLEDRERVVFSASGGFKLDFEVDLCLRTLAGGSYSARSFPKRLIIFQMIQFRSRCLKMILT